MLFAITTIRSAATDAAGAAVSIAHRAYMTRHSASILAVGATVRGDGKVIGSVCIFEAETLIVAAQFVQDDPMTASGQDTIDIVEWQMEGFDRIYPFAT